MVMIRVTTMMFMVYPIAVCKRLRHCFMEERNLCGSGRNDATKK